MTDTELRSELLETLAELSHRYPQWRMGQLLANVADWADRNVWDIEDAELIRIAREHLAHAEPVSI